MISVPKCSCSERSSDGQVFTCPECMRAALQFWDGEGVDQYEIFDDLDTLGSVSALSRSRSELTPIADVLRSLSEADGLPF